MLPRTHFGPSSPRCTTGEAEATLPARPSTTGSTMQSMGIRHDDVVPTKSGFRSSGIKGDSQPGRLFSPPCHCAPGGTPVASPRGEDRMSLCCGGGSPSDARAKLLQAGELTARLPAPINGTKRFAIRRAHRGSCGGLARTPQPSQRWEAEGFGGVVNED
jgi:hypothetical protein